GRGPQVRMIERPNVVRAACDPVVRRSSGDRTGRVAKVEAVGSIGLVVRDLYLEANPCFRQPDPIELVENGRKVGVRQAAHGHMDAEWDAIHRRLRGGRRRRASSAVVNPAYTDWDPAFADRGSSGSGTAGS